MQAKLDERLVTDEADAEEWGHLQRKKKVVPVEIL